MATTAVRRPAKTIFDTSVYIQALLDPALSRRVEPYFEQLLPTTYFCAVVAQEPRARCRTAGARRRIEALVDPFRRVGQLGAPTFADWELAGDLLARLFENRRDLRNKIPALVNDSLVALCAVRIGAVVITANLEDFELFRSYRRFRVATAPG